LFIDGLFWIDATDYPNDGDWHWASNHQKVTYGTIQTIDINNSKIRNCAMMGPSGEMFDFPCQYKIVKPLTSTVCQIVI
jgi:hypothetical protein